MLSRSVSLFPCVRRGLPLFAACLFVASSANSAIITVSGSLTATTAAGSSIALGDVFDYSFTFDDATVDSDAQTYNAQFSSGVSAVSLQRRAGNTGTWNPSSGTFTTINFIVGANSDYITLQAQGTGFPSINGTAFFDLGLNFAWQSSTRNFVDTGSGQTFAQVVGVSPLSFATADSSLFAEIRDTSYNSPGFNMTVNGAGGGASVPEGAVFAPLALGLGALVVGHRRRR